MEISQFTTKYLKLYFHENFHNKKAKTEIFIAIKYLFTMVKQVEESHKSGNKRFKEEVKNLTLYKVI